LDSILHAEHKGILEEMRTDYSFSHSMGKRKTINDGSASSDSASSDGKFVTNGKESEYAGDDINGVGSVERYEEEDNELDLLGSSDKNAKKYSDGGSRFVPNCLAGIRLFSCCLELKTFIEIF